MIFLLSAILSLGNFASNPTRLGLTTSLSAGIISKSVKLGVFILVARSAKKAILSNQELIRRKATEKALKFLSKHPQYTDKVIKYAKKLTRNRNTAAKDKANAFIRKVQLNRKGGAHRDMKKPTGDKKDSHHIPDRYADPKVHPDKGTAIKMDPRDHKETGSNGYKGKNYRAKNKEMIKNGQKRDVYAREIKDARNAAYKVSRDRKKYNQGLKEMLDYGKKTGQVPPK